MVGALAVIDHLSYYREAGPQAVVTFPMSCVDQGGRLMSGHPIVHVEIPAADPRGTSQFYAEVFGWRVHTDPSFDYTMFAAEGGPGGGFVRPSDEPAPNGDA